MPQDAFTAGVKPGGLTSSTEIRILLCYLMQSVPAPLSQTELQNALLGEELVNYFELADGLHGLCQSGLAKEENGRYILLPPGREIASTLLHSVPLSVRETGVRAAVAAQQFARKEAQHKAVITHLENGYMLRCSIDDMGSEVFSFSLYLPDSASAALVKQQFIERGGEIYRLMLAGATGNKPMITDALGALGRE